MQSDSYGAALQPASAGASCVTRLSLFASMHTEQAATVVGALPAAQVGG